MYVTLSAEYRTTAMFLRNAWYAAAFDRSVSRALLPLKILGESVVLYRTERGDGVIALENACPHRKVPLSMGRVIGDSIECGYHGLTFAPNGNCVRVPGAGRIPKGARVRRYPTLCRYGLVWIWMGSPEHSDAEKVFPVDHWQDPAWGRNQGDTLDLNCNYLFVTDNLLDPSHVAWVHRSSFGSEECAHEPVQVTASDSGVAVSRWIRNADVAPFYAPFVRFQGRCDRLQHYEVRFPCHAVIRAVLLPAGAVAADPIADERAFVMDSYNFMTPVDAHHTRYFWFQLRNFAPDDSTISEQMVAGVRAAFEEDRRILNAVEAGFAEARTPNIDLAVDSGPLRFRRRLARLIEAESTTADIRVG
jgi:phenylpropionate dioxygenase-like ring-hydroxylating dioxygenase large terminal subunit